MSATRRRLKAQRNRENVEALHRAHFKGPACTNCGEQGAHFVPPSMGEPGFFHCTPGTPEQRRQWQIEFMDFLIKDSQRYRGKLSRR